MLLHFLNNSLSVTLSRIPALEKIEIAPADIPVLAYVSAFVLLGAAAYALYRSRVRLVPQTPEQIVMWRPPWQGVEHPPPNSGTRVVCPTPSLAALALIVAALSLLATALANWKVP
jgi:hypothetical protein